MSDRSQNPRAAGEIEGADGCPDEARTVTALSSASGIDALVPEVYQTLHRMARQLMARERRGHTLRPTDLLHEALLRLAGATSLDCQNPVHLQALASGAMVRVLLDHQRRRSAGKRGGPGRVSAGELRPATPRRLPTEALDAVAAKEPNCTLTELCELAEALELLAQVDERAAMVVQLRHFGGLQFADIARVFNLSERTVESDWRLARGLLKKDLG